MVKCTSPRFPVSELRDFPALNLSRTLLAPDLNCYIRLGRDDFFCPEARYCITPNATANAGRLLALVYMHDATSSHWVTAD